MDLWIRSQPDYTEQNLIKAEQVKVGLVIDDIWEVKVNNERVAEYKSRKRAIEVLNKIQKYLYSSCTTINELGLADDRTLSLGIVVYEMPADDEVK